jgi:PAS domain S-box-containing protein
MSFESTKTPRSAASARLRAALLESQRRVLERIASGAPLEEILETLVRLIEEQAGDMRCARVAIEAKGEDAILRTIFEGAPDGLVITDLMGKIVRVNPAFAGMLGYTPAELHGRGIADITEGQDNAALIEDLALSEGKLASDRRYRTRSGEILWGRERSSLRRDTARRPRYVLTQVLKMTGTGSDSLERLSRRERQVLGLVVSGLTSKEIAARLDIAPASVDTYRSRIMVKLGVEDLPGLVRFAILHGIASV